MPVIKKAAEEKKQQQLTEMVKFAHDRLPPDVFATMQPFMANYYSQVGEEQVQSRNISDLYGAVMSHWQFARHFKTGAPRVRIYNPQIDEHGWESAHSVIEIVNDDMPFLVDSVTTEINRLGLTLHAAIHPVFRVWRDASGQVERIQAATDISAKIDEQHNAPKLESYIHFEIDRCTEPHKLEEILTGVKKVLSDVRAAVEDWHGMMTSATAAVTELNDQPGKDDTQQAEIDEGRAFLEWMINDHFTFLGCRDYELVINAGENYLQAVAGSGLGILRDSLRDTTRSSDSADMTKLPSGAQAIIDSPSPVFITKADSRATVHRPGYLDYVGVKRYDTGGKVIGERRFVGLYTSTAYMVTTSDIPIIRRKVAKVRERASFVPKGHLAKTLTTILEQYPRDELFQVDEDNLYDTAIGILRLEERQRTRLFVRRDAFGRYVSCLVYVPRDKFNTELRVRIQTLLLDAFNGLSIEFTPLLSDSVLARIQFTVRTEAGTVTNTDISELETKIVQATRRWQDDLADALLENRGEEHGNRLLRRYAASFPAGFREDYAARATVRDIELMELAQQRAGLAMNLYRPIEAAASSLRLKIYHSGKPIALSQSLPMLEHMGVKVQEERPYRIEVQDAAPVWIHDFGMQTADGGEVEIDRIKDIFEDAFAHVWNGEADNDDLNRLVFGAQLNWREVTILRAYARYLRQVGSTFSNAYIEQALTGNPSIARKLVELFIARFDPAANIKGGRPDQVRIDTLLQQTEEAMDQVPNLDEDRILRQFLGVIQATLRTNYFQRDVNGKPKPYLSFKFDPAKVPGLPAPKPMFEIWVYSPRFEGVHLRGGKVARGGLRWSDRREDFRTEVLGLVKAQMVKNAVIVPVGSKGGFVLKNAPPASDREAYLKEGIACYQNFLRGLLDLTDNLVGGKVVPPTDVVRYDADDPYLVVAADKGTATFSDFANAISAEYGFWLTDAFASGGSVGYDHKKMGITARGAWEAVKRHFREIGVNTQEQDFTVAGIGDMSGDVFGNGMLLSNHIKLVAAFDHRHIFLDPNPDTAASFAERARLFVLPRSSWADYDAKLLSVGGGIYPRSLKTVPLSPEVRAALGVTATELAPTDLIHAILVAPVDMLYNGGIGTYVKAGYESHAQVGDRANDAIRVNGAQLQCKVVAEGGNLGLTQFGRIEFAQKGGRICTDAIDNSAGVDCSDHEVNIKILLGLVVTEGEMTEKQRNKLLAEMTDEVGKQVLTDNYYQTQALSVAGRCAASLLEPEARLIRYLERAGRLDRTVEFLPSEEAIAERKTAKQGLTTPERAVLMAYNKMWLYETTLASDLLDDQFISRALAQYFPQPLRERYPDVMSRHPLAREIIATYVVNTFTNRVGTTFVHQLSEESGASPTDVIRASIIARDVFGFEDIWSDIDALDNVVPDALQAQMFIAVGRLIEQASFWFLHRHATAETIEAMVARFRPAADQLGPILVSLLTATDAEALKAKQAALMQAGVSETLARRVASAELIGAVLDIAEVATVTGRSLELVAQVYFALDLNLNFGWMRERAATLPVDTHWQTLARTALQSDLTTLQRALTANVIQLSPTLDQSPEMVEVWQSANRPQLERYRRLLIDFQLGGNVDLAMLSVAAREMRAIETK
ncbi:NAD-glutamate dehydrogenase [Glaciimonas sp. Gout2]|uniref:NAD-glutamate dehydrogenase n=2 Tax=unclassified Glaciimonas TaxID=2644401 RepID=UPI002AB5B80A|nr:MULTISPECIES: NAD-glutamate dehydrogenase [unclassified Glaciimonas]MDY7548564.1 NAD-glutamate dehydrogenase [Glaciimonas sp. CA11.2]MEB0013751.1 NAD-glutamate dehydrogenase [Glaciimonas sp. Cout2]MEB0083356.1 NAD-glutamate dehydrogenase [Glaciimonas sp. Gout2]